MAQVFGPGGRRGPMDPLENILKRTRRRRIPWGWVVLGLAILLALIALNIGPGIYTEILWFQSLRRLDGLGGLESVYFRTLGAQLTLFGLGTLAAFVVLLVNVLLAHSLASRQEMDDIPPQERLSPGRIVTVALVAGALFLAVL